MTKTEIRKALLKLAPEERFELADEVYSTLPADVELHLTPELKEILEDRLADAKANPDTGISVEKAHAEIRNRLR